MSRPEPLRTLPEQAFRARARLVALLLCGICFAGLIARLYWLQLAAGDWYTRRALGQQLRDTVVPADRGRIYSADGVLLAANSSCWTLRASPREMPADKLELAAHLNSADTAFVNAKINVACWRHIPAGVGAKQPDPLRTIFPPESGNNRFNFRDTHIKAPHLSQSYPEIHGRRNRW